MRPSLGAAAMFEPSKTRLQIPLPKEVRHVHRSWRVGDHPHLDPATYLKIVVHLSQESRREHERRGFILVLRCSDSLFRAVSSGRNVALRPSNKTRPQAVDHVATTRISTLALPAALDNRQTSILNTSALRTSAALTRNHEPP